MTQASDLSGLELRRAVLIALGWEAIQTRVYYNVVSATAWRWSEPQFMSPEQSLHSYGPNPHPDQFNKVDIRNVEPADFKRAIQFEESEMWSERALIELCRKHGWSWNLEWRYPVEEEHRAFYCEIVHREASGWKGIAFGYGATPSEARCRAIVAFAEAQKKRDS